MTMIMTRMMIRMVMWMMPDYDPTHHHRLHDDDDDWDDY